MRYAFIHSFIRQHVLGLALGCFSVFLFYNPSLLLQGPRCSLSPSLQGKRSSICIRTTGMMIASVAVVGQENNPLYLQSFIDGDDALKFHYIVHSSLDIIEEKVNNPKKPGVSLNETYLGLLYPTEDYRVFGYLSNTKIKFILVTTDQDVRDADVRNFFHRFHAAYVEAASNPFHVPGKRITATAFTERVTNIVKSFGASSLA